MDWTKIDIADIAKVAIIGVGGWIANIVRKKALPLIKSLIKFSTVSDRHDELERRVRIEESRNKALRHIDPHPIFITDNEGNVTYVNPAWAEMAGLDERDAMGKGYLQAIPDEDIEEVEHNSERLAKTPYSFREEVNFKNVRTGDKIRTICRSEPVYDGAARTETIGRIYIIEIK